MTKGYRVIGFKIAGLSRRLSLRFMCCEACVYLLEDIWPSCESINRLYFTRWRALFVMDGDGSLRRATPGMQLKPGMRPFTELTDRWGYEAGV